MRRARKAIRYELPTDVYTFSPQLNHTELTTSAGTFLGRLARDVATRRTHRDKPPPLDATTHPFRPQITRQGQSGERHSEPFLDRVDRDIERRMQRVENELIRQQEECRQQVCSPLIRFSCFYTVNSYDLLVRLECFCLGGSPSGAGAGSGSF